MLSFSFERTYTHKHDEPRPNGKINKMPFFKSCWVSVWVLFVRIRDSCNARDTKQLGNISSIHCYVYHAIMNQASNYIFYLYIAEAQIHFYVYNNRSWVWNTKRINHFKMVSFEQKKIKSTVFVKAS